MWYNPTGSQPMEMQEIVHEEIPYEPTTEQVRRTAELRRFNVLFVYLPIGFISAVVVALVAILFVVAINPPSLEALLFISGLADVALMIAILPMLLIGAIILALIGYAYTQGRQAGMAPIRQTQRLLWRMDNLAGRIRVRTEETTASARQPFIAVNGAVTYVRVLVTQLLRIVKRS
jgi:hypothetical protein